MKIDLNIILLPDTGLSNFIISIILLPDTKLGNFILSIIVNNFPDQLNIFLEAMTAAQY